MKTETLSLGHLTLFATGSPAGLYEVSILLRERPVANFPATPTEWQSLLAIVDTKAAQDREIERLTAELVAVNERASDALDYMKFNTGDTQHLRNAEEILVGNMDKDGKWIVREVASNG